MLKKIATMLFSISAFLVMLNAAEKYAVLITGEHAAPNFSVDEAKPSEYIQNEDGEWIKSTAKHPVFWNDTYLMWEMLIEKGYKDENIFVLFAGGTDYWVEDEEVARRYTPLNYNPNYPETFQITDTCATYDAVEWIAGELESTLTADDFLFLWTCEHGDKVWNSETQESDVYIKLIDINDSNAFVPMSDEYFASLFNPIKANKKVYWFQPCYSGAFLDDLEGEDTYFNSATTSSIIASHTDDRYPDPDNPGEYLSKEYSENDTINNVFYKHGEFDFHMYSVTSGTQPDGSNNYHGELYTDGDLNSDNFITVDEARIWCDDHFSVIFPSGIPQYSDIGYIGTHTSLEYPTLIHNNYHEYTNHLKGIMAIPLDLNVTRSDLILPANSETMLLEDRSLAIKSGYTLYVQSGAELKLLENSKLIVESGGQLIIEPNSIIEAETDVRIVVEYGGMLSANGANITGENWEGIIARIGSIATLDNVNISGARTCFYGVDSDCIIRNSIFENCFNGIRLANCENYEIFNNTLSGIGLESGTGVSLTYCTRPIIDNFISSFRNGVSLVSSNTTLIRNNIIDNTNNGLFVTGNGSTPILIDTSTKDLTQTDKNNRISDNGLDNPFYDGAQIHMRFSAGVYMNKGHNNVYSGVQGSIPSIPCIKGVISGFSDPSISRVLIAAEENYWGGADINGENTHYFFSLAGEPLNGNAGYSIDYEPYSLLAYPKEIGTVGLSSNDPESSESKQLIRAMKLEQDEKYNASIKLYEHIIDKYAETPEYYVAMSRLPKVYDKAGESLEPLMAIYDEAIESEETSNKKFFKSMKIATRIKGKKYDEAIVLAEEMKAEADNEEEKLLSDIDIAVCNMMKNAHNNKNGRNYTDELAEIDTLINDLIGDDKSELTDITESIIASEFTLYQNYPNPFNPFTTIKFLIPQDSEVKLSVYNCEGQLVSELVNSTKNAGFYTVEFDGSKLNSGVYYYRLEVGGSSITKKMILTK